MNRHQPALLRFIVLSPAFAITDAHTIIIFLFILQITHRETIREINEQLGAALVVKGRYYKAGERVPEGERKLYLHITGPTPDIVRRAKGDVKRILEESTEKAMRKEAPAAGRYNVM